MERWCPLRGTDYFARHKFCLAAKLLDGHGHMFGLIYPLEGFEVLRTRIDNDQLNVTHFRLLEVKFLYPEKCNSFDRLSTSPIVRCQDVG
jgi:hypothetical protein